jgi:starch phosphorylase
MDVDALTIGFARRAPPTNDGPAVPGIERLKGIASKIGALQIIYSGKAHPQDGGGKELIKKIFYDKELLKNDIKIAYVENYDLELGKIITSGVDVWLNTPQPPMEASGTSGMKAALNGVPSLSILDGWWIEMYRGSLAGPLGKTTKRTEKCDASSLYANWKHDSFHRHGQLH